MGNLDFAHDGCIWNKNLGINKTIKFYWLMTVSLEIFLVHHPMGNLDLGIIIKRRRDLLANLPPHIFIPLKRKTLTKTNV